MNGKISDAQIVKDAKAIRTYAEERARRTRKPDVNGTIDQVMATQEWAEASEEYKAYLVKRFERKKRKVARFFEGSEAPSK